MVQNWRGDGIISRTINLKTAKILRATHLPIVEMHGSEKIGDAQVKADLKLIGIMAAEHLVNNGFRHFGYFTYGETAAVRDHRNCFCNALRAKGFECHLYPALAIKELVPHWDERLRPALEKWLRSLPRPIAIFSYGDTYAVRLLNLCRELNLAVPEEIAVLGSGNDSMICETIRPTLSSIDLDSKRIGYEAARLLDRKMAGKITNELVLIPPSHIEVRQSTDLMVIDDPDMVQAMRFIRNNGCLGIDIDVVAEEVGLSLSGLSRKFHKYLGRTPKSEIMPPVRIEYAEKLLSQTDRNCASIAKKAGFNSPGNFVRAFHREVGMTPNAYRRIDRAHPLTNLRPQPVER